MLKNNGVLPLIFLAYKPFELLALHPSCPPKTQYVCIYSARENGEARSLFIFNSPPLFYDRHDIGDAAYCASPASGQGTSLALVGAYVLAGELAAASGDHHTAFARYEQTMREYVEVNQEFALRAIKGFTPRTRTQIWLQNQMLRMLPHLPFQQVIARNITQGIGRAANALTLKDYEACGDIQCWR